jgi:hypothetical protein
MMFAAVMALNAYSTLPILVSSFGNDGMRASTEGAGGVARVIGDGGQD